jgi:hypothetical protein
MMWFKSFDWVEGKGKNFFVAYPTLLKPGLGEVWDVKGMIEFPAEEVTSFGGAGMRDLPNGLEKRFDKLEGA